LWSFGSVSDAKEFLEGIGEEKKEKIMIKSSGV
jgi:hypothetical protein